MSQKSGTAKLSSEWTVKDIRRATRKQHSAEEKIRLWNGHFYRRSAVIPARRHSHARDSYSNCGAGERDMVLTLAPEHLARSNGLVLDGAPPRSRAGRKCALLRKRIDHKDLQCRCATAHGPQ
jgi:hypothetical protein